MNAQLAVRATAMSRGSGSTPSPTAAAAITGMSVLATAVMLVGSKSVSRVRASIFRRMGRAALTSQSQVGGSDTTTRACPRAIHASMAHQNSTNGAQLSTF
jgi:hypothetical protein